MEDGDYGRHEQMNAVGSWLFTRPDPNDQVDIALQAPYRIAGFPTRISAEVVVLGCHRLQADNGVAYLFLWRAGSPGIPRLFSQVPLP